ncbi:MAG: cytochrome-c peroxidase, partial [Bacteroidota bacterium]|nr:cytochrome-c peroxidase [Bacteroidota bacterium]
MHRYRFIFALVMVFLLSLRWVGNTVYRFPELRLFPKMPVAKNNPVTIEGANLGRYLFYDPILSMDSDMSCSNCHRQKFAFSDSALQLSRGRNGISMKRNTMALFNLAWYPSLFWDGRAPSIEEQVFHPLKEVSEMNLQLPVAVERLNKNARYKSMFAKVFDTGQIDSGQIASAIGQFLRTLISSNSKYDMVLSGHGTFTDEEYAGYVLMNDQTKGDCLHCHTTDADMLGTTLNFSNNGLDQIANPADYKDKGRGSITGKI